MKNLYLFLLFILINTTISAQWITSITINPPQPTPADTITVIIENTFPSGGCEGTSAVTGINGSIITAEGTHCIGMLTVICTDYDTLIFEPQSLPTGTYTLAYTLQTGGGFPCAFGIMPPVEDTLLFNVYPLTAISEIEDQDILQIFPNPSNGKFTIKKNDAGLSTVKIYSVDGRNLFSFQLNTLETEINCSLKSGVYFLSHESNGSVMYSKIVVEK